MSGARETPGVTVDVIATLFNGAAYLGEFLASLEAQTHPDWRLWVRDDGSTDETLAILDRASAADPRITLLQRGGPRLGPAAGFGWLLERVPPAAGYVMCADQDDVWLPGKIARTLSVMRGAEAVSRGPILVHTDLVVVDHQLRVVDPSFWRFSGIDPEPVSLRRLVVQNIATGATIMLNRPLRELIGVMPPEAVHQDWWYACVAAAFGRIVPLREATILYRQHGANAVGAKRVAPPRWTELPSLAWEAMGRKAHLRADIARSARQAGAFLARFGERLNDDDRRFLAAYARLPGLGSFRRKLELARLRVIPDHGLWRSLGVLLRA